MKVEYDQNADAVYLYLTSKKKKISKSREVEPGVVLDLDEEKNIIGIEILNVSRRFTSNELFQFSVKHIAKHRSIV